jgi:hypothetical protein
MVPYARHRSKELESISQETRGRYDVQMESDLKRLLKLQHLKPRLALNELGCSRLHVSGHRRIEELDSKRKLRRRYQIVVLAGGPQQTAVSSMMST